jgi:hypothetical protein
MKPRLPLVLWVALWVSLLAVSLVLIALALRPPRPVSGAEVLLAIAGSLLVGAVLGFLARWERRWLSDRLNEVRDDLADNVEDVRDELGGEVSNLRSTVQSLQARISDGLQTAASERTDLAHRAATNLLYDDAIELLRLAVARRLIRQRGISYIFAGDRQLLVRIPTLGSGATPINLTILRNFRGLDRDSGLSSDTSISASWSVGTPEAAFVDLGQRLQQKTEFWVGFEVDSTQALRDTFATLGSIIEQQDKGTLPRDAYRGGLVAIVPGGWVVAHRGGLFNIDEHSHKSIAELHEQSATPVDRLSPDPSEQRAITVARAALATEFRKRSSRAMFARGR